jgi:hypothetical protein
MFYFVPDAPTGSGQRQGADVEEDAQHSWKQEVRKSLSPVPLSLTAEFLSVCCGEGCQLLQRRRMAGGHGGALGKHHASRQCAAERSRSTIQTNYFNQRKGRVSNKFRVNSLGKGFNLHI